jgi:hypothetical protein
MSLLHQNSPELDDAARGEELTKGSGHLVITTIIATVVVSIAIAIYVLAGQKPPDATGEIEQVWTHAQHSETSGFDANGSPMPKESMDQVYVFALVRLHNQSKEPLYMHNIMTNATLDDGFHSSYAATAADYDRVFIAYPAMPVPHGPGLSLTSTIDPGQTVEGTIVSAFHLTKQQWDARKDLSFTFAFQYKPSLTLTSQAAVIDR